MLVRTLRLLDEVQNAAQLEAFAPARFAAVLAEELSPADRTLVSLGQSLDALRALLGNVDRFAEKAMRIRLHQLADPLPPQLRTLLSSTLASYANDLGLLRERLTAMLARLRRADTGTILDLARSVLDARAALRQAILDAAQRVAGEWQEAAKTGARDRSQPDEERERWGKARADLVELAARGAVLEEGSFEERLARRAPVEGGPAGPHAPAGDSRKDDEPDDPVSKRFSLIEYD